MLVELWPAPKASYILSSLLGKPASPQVCRIVCILDLLPVKILCAYAWERPKLLSSSISEPPSTNTTKRAWVSSSDLNRVRARREIVKGLPDAPRPKLSCPRACRTHGEVQWLVQPLLSFCLNAHQFLTLYKQSPPSVQQPTSQAPESTDFN